MKIRYLYIFAFITAVILISSCNKDKVEIKKEFTYENQTYVLDKGYIEDFGKNDNESYDFDVFLFSEGIVVKEMEPTGKGHAIYFDLNSPISTGLAKGKYTYNSERDAFNYTNAGAILNADISSETGEEIDVMSGDINISFNDDKTILKFNLKTTDNKSLIGEFEGILQKF